MSVSSEESRTWVAYGPAGAVGSVHRTDGGFTFRLLKDSAPRGVYPNLDGAKSALHSALGPYVERPEFREH